MIHRESYVEWYERGYKVGSQNARSLAFIAGVWSAVAVLMLVEFVRRYYS